MGGGHGLPRASALVGPGGCGTIPPVGSGLSDGNHSNRDRRRLLPKRRILPRAAPLPAAEDQDTESSPVGAAPQADEQTTDLTGRPGTPSTVRRRAKGRGRPRSLLGPESWAVGSGIRPEKEEAFFDDPSDEVETVKVPFVPSTAEYTDPSGATVGVSGLDEHFPPELLADPDAPTEVRSDPFAHRYAPGHSDEIDPFSAIVTPSLDFDPWEVGVFDRETQPLDPSLLPTPPYDRRALWMGAAVVLFAAIAVFALALSAWTLWSYHPAGVAGLPAATQGS